MIYIYIYIYFFFFWLKGKYHKTTKQRMSQGRACLSTNQRGQPLLGQSSPQGGLLNKIKSES